jgi:hypothetical protein
VCAVLISIGRGGGIYRGPRRGNALGSVGNTPSGARPT